jgi:hypothetical protein
MYTFDDPKRVIASVHLLCPCDKWRVGSPVTIRGAVFPQASRVQLLIQPWDEAWYVINDIEVHGFAWSYNYRFTNNSPHRIVAVHGNSLKSPQYDEIPENVIKSEIVLVQPDSSQPDPIDCSDKQLHQTKIDDKKAIKDTLVVAGIQYRKMDEGPEPPYIDFGIVILNMSLHPISVESISGVVTFFEAQSGKPINFGLAPKLKESESALRVGFRQTGYFVVQQKFETANDANFFLNEASPDSLFQFKSLAIRLTVDGSDDIVINPDITFSKKQRQWVAHDEMDFIYVRYLMNPKSALEDIQSEHARELKLKDTNYQSRLDRIVRLGAVRGRAEQLLHGFSHGPTPSPDAIHHWAELLEKALIECYGVEGVSKFDDKRDYSVKAPEAQSEHSNWVYLNWQRLGDLIKEETAS